MARLRPFALRSRIIALFVIGVLLATAVTTAIGVRQSTDDFHDALLSRQGLASQGVAASAEFLLEAANRTIAAAAPLMPAAFFRPTIDEEDIGAVLDAVVAHGDLVTSLHVVTATGEAIVSRPDRADAPALADDPAFTTAVATLRPELSLRAGASPLWVHVIRSTADDDDPYFLVGPVNTNRLTALLFNHGLDETHAALVDPAGRPLAATDPRIDAGRLADWGVRVDDAVGVLEVAGAADADSEVILSMATLSRHPLSVLLISSASVLSEGEEQIVRGALFTALVLVGVAVLVGVYTSHSIARPVQGLQRVAKRMERGDLAARAAPAGSREFRDLAGAFNDMARSLDERNRGLLELQGELEDNVARRTEQLHAKQREMELFFYGVSHDIKNPVIAIRSMAQLVAEEMRNQPMDTNEILEIQRRIERSSATLQDLVQSLLHFARADRDSPEITLMDAAETLNAVRDEMENIAKTHDVTLYFRGPRIDIATDAKRLRMIVTNLVRNAVVHMPKDRKGRAAVSWEPNATGMTVRIQDDGGGIPEGVQKTLFQPFSRDPSGTGSGGGSGLGLSIVKKLADTLDATIDMRTEAGRGTLFEIQIPDKRPGGKKAHE